jgi:hypothetical protein
MAERWMDAPGESVLKPELDLLSPAAMTAKRGAIECSANCYGTL